MTEVYLVKSPGGILRPAHDADAEVLARIKTGALLMADIKQPRNIKFHRKFWAMINFFFGVWEPPQDAEICGIKAQKSLDRFRKDILILAGFRTLIVNIKGECRYEAESISFASMDETRFSSVYDAVFNVCWDKIIPQASGLSREQAEAIINEALSYD